MLIKLRPYQQDIVKKVVDSDKSTLIQIPTGGGKTIIAREIIIKLINDYKQQILFVAPKIVLMEQTMEVFKGLRPHIVHGTNKYDFSHHLLVSTIQTASRRNNLNPDVIIIDEIHYGFDGIMIEKLMKDKPNTRVIGLSATPYDKNGKLLNGFDLILNEYDMRYMINHNYLVPLKSYVLAKPNLDNVKIVAGDYDIKELGQVVCNKNTIMEIIETTKDFITTSKKTIVFAVDIEHAELLAKAYRSIGFNVKTLHSKLPKDEIKKEINSFREGYNNTKILVSVLMLTTGFDVPDTDCAVIARPTKSQNLYKQMVGRILRIAENKKNAILLDCGNVIENLGMPLEPIKIIDGNEIVNKLKCNVCNSENLKLIKYNDIFHWKCLDCGSLKEIEQGSYECSNCHQMHDLKSDFIFENNKLILNCDCGFQTIISEYDGKEELILVEDTTNLTESSKKSSKIDDFKINVNDTTNSKTFGLFIEEILSDVLFYHPMYKNDFIESLISSGLTVLEGKNISHKNLLTLYCNSRLKKLEIEIEKIKDSQIKKIVNGELKDIKFLSSNIKLLLDLKFDSNDTAGDRLKLLKIVSSITATNQYEEYKNPLFQDVNGTIIVNKKVPILSKTKILALNAEKDTDGNLIYNTRTLAHYLENLNSNNKILKKKYLEN